MHTAAIRIAEIGDAQRILEIYAPYVAKTTLTLTSEVPTQEEVAETLISLKKRFPYLVCCIDNEVVGFAYAFRQHLGAAYNWNAELSIYIDPDYHGRGIATALYTALVQILKIQGYCNLYAIITNPNEASVALHTHFGFKELVVMKKNGYKLGEWQDVLWMEYRIPDCQSPEHGNPLAIESLNKNELFTILAMSTALLSGAQKKSSERV